MGFKSPCHQVMQTGPRSAKSMMGRSQVIHSGKALERRKTVVEPPDRQGIHTEFVFRSPKKLWSFWGRQPTVLKVITVCCLDLGFSGCYRFSSLLPP